MNSSSPARRIISFGGNGCVRTSTCVSYPNEVCHNVFLGSAACVNAAAVANLRVSHVLSIVDRRMAAPPGTTHRLCRVPDEESADLTPVMRVALPFLAAALRSGGRVLVHCDRGASRSASVVIAHLMQHPVKASAK
mmetsp:Transcript_1301/g.4136  ORF Transcript_1301/g.4136 Transcript_1301/m.4136 type:complete len:136 (+) Transcript_1301:3-410(+)